MTTSFDLNKAAILRNAYQMAGIVMPGADPDSTQIAMGSDFLNAQIKALQSEGIILTTVQQTVVTLTAGTAAYTLASSILDVDTRTPFVSNNGSPATNVPLEWYSRGMYMALTVPTTQGQPTSIYVQKSNPIVVFLYPVPDSTWPTMTLPTVSFLPDLTSGTDDTTLLSKYLRTIVMGVAKDLALSFGLMPRYQALAQEYETAKKIARNDDTERGNIRLMPDYGYGYFGRRI